MKFGTLSGKKSPEELFHDYTETYVGNRQPIPRGEFGGNQQKGFRGLCLMSPMSL